MRQRGSTVPVAGFRHGGVWAVTLQAPRRRRYLDLAEAWEADQHEAFDALILLTAPYEPWPEAPMNYYRSRICVGDLRKRLIEEALGDFRCLLRQTPPVLRNWRSNLEKHRETVNGRGQTYHILWKYEMDRLRAY